MDIAELKKYLVLKQGLIEEALKPLDETKELTKEQFIIGMGFKAQLGFIVEMLSDIQKGVLK